MRLPWSKNNNTESVEVPASNDVVPDADDVPVDDAALEETGKPQKEKVQLFARRTARAARTTMQSILTKKVYMNDKRVAFARDLWSQAQRDALDGLQAAPSAVDADSAHLNVEDAARQPAADSDGVRRLFLVNFDAPQAQAIEAALRPHGYVVRAETLRQRHWVTLVHTSRPAFHIPCEPTGDPLRRADGASVEDSAAADAASQPASPVKDAPAKDAPRRKSSSSWLPYGARRGGKAKAVPALTGGDEGGLLEDVSSEAAEASAADGDAGDKKAGWGAWTRGKPAQIGDVPDVVVVRLTSAEMTEFDECTLAVHWVVGRVVIPFVDVQGEEGQGALLEKLGRFMGGTWPSFSDVRPLLEYCQTSVGPILTMKQLLVADIYGRCGKWGRVNYVWHGLKRAPLSFVPLGVTAINFVGISRLVSRMLAVTGMLGDPQAKKAAAAVGGKSFAKVFVLAHVADVYHALVAGSIIGTLTTAVMSGASITAAVSALSAADLALLGSVAVVSGIVAGICAAITRPQMVRTMCELIALLQLLWVLFPDVRRTDCEAIELAPEEAQVAAKLGRIAFPKAMESPYDYNGDSAELDSEIEDDAVVHTLELFPDDVPLAGPPGPGGAPRSDENNDPQPLEAARNRPRLARPCGGDAAAASSSAQVAALSKRQRLYAWAVAFVQAKSDEPPAATGGAASVAVVA